MANSVSTDAPQTLNNTATTSPSEDVQTDYSGRFQTGYGCRRCRPACLQFLASTRWFLLFTSLGVFFASMTVNGLVGVTISTIERRFSLASSQAAWIVGAYEIAGAPASLIIGYLGLSLRRPVWIGGGVIMMGIGFGIYAVPHFAASPYRYSGESSNLCIEPALNASNNVSLLPNYRCNDDAAGDSSKYLAAFMVSMVLLAFGVAPLYLLGVTYLDDASPPGPSSVHIGVFFAFAVLGPVVAFIIGGFLLDTYTHFETIDTSTITLQQNDPRWVGAWWVGFVAVMVATLIMSPIFFGYPPDPSTEYYLQKSTSSSDSVLDREQRMDIRVGGVGEFKRRMKSLVTDGVYMFVVWYGVFESVVVSGFVVFGPKYFQQQFGLTASMAGIVFGIVSVPGGAGGFILAGIINKRMSLTVEQQLRAIFIMAVVSLFAMVMFTVQCDTAPLADMTSYHQPSDRTGDGTSKSGCSVLCPCQSEWFEPVCGADGLTYFSPCYAGCQNTFGDEQYGNCSCIGDVSTNTNDVNRTATAGVCDIGSCHTWRLVVFIIIFFVVVLFSFISEMFSVSAVLRFVDQSIRPFAYGVGWLFLRLAGEIPGPLLFGWAIDHSCLLWEQKCDGSTGACLYYDNHHMAWLLLAVCAVCKVVTVIFSLLGWRLYINKQRKGDSPETKVELDTPTVAETGNRYTSAEDIVEEEHDDQEF